MHYTFFNLPRLVPLVLYYAAVISRGRLTLVFRLSLPPWLYYGDVNFGWCEYYGIHGPVESFHIQEMGNGTEGCVIGFALRIKLLQWADQSLYPPTLIP